MNFDMCFFVSFSVFCLMLL